MSSSGYGLPSGNPAPEIPFGLPWSTILTMAAKVAVIAVVVYLVIDYFYPTIPKKEKGVDFSQTINKEKFVETPSEASEPSEPSDGVF